MNIADIEDADMEGPTKFALHSVEGFGKTTLASHFPSPVWISPENGFPRDLTIRPRVIKCATWEDIKAAVVMLTEQPHDYQTLVFDTMDWVEPMAQAYVMERDSGRKTELNKGGHKLLSIEDYGFGKGFIASEEELHTLIPLLDQLQHKRRMHIVMLMHSKISKFENPSGQNYDRYEPKMHARFAGVIKEWAENLLFGFYETAVAKLDERDKKAKGVSTGKRLLGTRNNAAYDAKNRVQLPDEVELNDPRELIPYLLGEHMRDKVPARTEPRREPASAKSRHEPVPAGAEGKPAHHESRKDDENRRRNDALDRTRKQAAETPTKKIDPVDDPNAWGEPRRDAPQTPPPSKAKKTEAPTKDASKDDPTTARIRELTELLVEARKKLGDAYVTKVEKWIGMAKGDVDKIESIIVDVKKSVAAKAA